MKNAAFTFKDIFSIPNSFIVHITNVEGAFGKGFAGEISKKYPHIKKDIKKCILRGY